MNEPIPNPSAQAQDNTIKDVHFAGDNTVFTFAPVQIGTKIETQIVQISVDVITQKPLIKASPYKGLKRFNFGDRDRFFGRDRLIAQLLQAVNQSSFSLVLGASGSGKSSVVRAGVVPELKKSLESVTQFNDFVLTPNNDPFDSLYRCLLSEEKDYSFRRADVEIAKEVGANTLSRVISKLKRDNERWLIFIDQFEELFTLCQDVETRKSFIEGIVQVANSGDSSIRLVLAMRADFLEQFSFHPTLGALANQNNIHLVTEMHPDELCQAIEQPAALNGVVFEEGLVKQIIRDVEGQSGCLPLLQYTLNLLWDTECRTFGADGRLNIEDRVLNRSSYAELEGVRGALQKRVNEIYKNLSQEQQTATKQIFVRLVNIVETDAGNKTVSRRAYRDEFSGSSVENTLNQFIDDNLLVSNYEYSIEQPLASQGSKVRQRATVEIAHEILLSSWDTLKRWLEEEKEAIILKNWLANETNQWFKSSLKNDSRANDDLLKGSRLEQILDFRDKGAFEKLGGLSPKEVEFVAASVGWRDRLLKEEQERQRREIEQERNARKAAQKTTIALAFSVFLATGFAFATYIRSINSQIIAITNKSEALLASNQAFDALLEELKAAQLFRRWSWLLGENTQLQIVTALQQVMHAIKEQNRMQDHRFAVNDVSFSPNGTIIASASDDATIKLWSQDGKLLHTLEGDQGHSDAVQSVSFSTDGQTLASASLDRTVKLWSIDGSFLRTIGEHEEQVTDLSFNPNSEIGTIASASLDGTIKFWDFNGKLVRSINFKENSNDLLAYVTISFNHEGTLIASGSSDGIIKVWDVRTGQLVRTFQVQNSDIATISFNPRDQTIASASSDGTIRIWTLEGSPSKTFRTSSHSDIETSQGSQGESEIEDLFSDDFTGRNDGRINISFSPDGQTLASTTLDRSIQVWNLLSESYTLLNGHTSRANSVAFNSDGQTIVSGGVDNTVRLWSLAPPDEPFQLGASKVLGFNSDNHVVAALDELNNTLEIKDFDQDKSVVIKEVTDLFTHVSFNPDGKIIASATNSFDDNSMAFVSAVQLWNTDGSLRTNFRSQTSGINYTSFSPNGEILLTASEDGLIKIWDIAGKEIATLEGHETKVISANFSPDSKLIASASDDSSIRLWSTDGKTSSILSGHTDQVNYVTFSPDGRRLASASSDSTVKIWSNDRRVLATLSGHVGRVNYVDFSPNDHILASAGNDGTVRFWNTTGQELKTLRSASSAEVLVASFSTDGRELLTIDSRNNVVIWRFDLNYLLNESCNWTQDYIRNNQNTYKSIQQLCDFAP